MNHYIIILKSFFLSNQTLFFFENYIYFKKDSKNHMTILICKNSSVHLLRVSLYPILYFKALLGLLHEYYFDRFNVCVIVCDCHCFCVIVCMSICVLWYLFFVCHYVCHCVSVCHCVGLCVSLCVFMCHFVCDIVCAKLE